jgi:hypothetical protein
VSGQPRAPGSLVTYSFTEENVFVAVLDQYADPQRVNQAWLDAQLAANTQPHVFFLGHEPAFKLHHADCLDDHPSDRDAFWESIEAEGGRTYFAGHDHFYDHTRLNDGDGNLDDDIHQFVVGTAGAPLRDWEINYDGENSYWVPQSVLHEKEYGYVVVEIDGLDVTLTWKHRTAPGVYEPGGDQFSYTIAAETTAQTPDQQKCILELNKNGAKVAKAQGKASGTCVKDALKSKISSAQACLNSPDEKVDKSKTKARQKAAAKCAPGQEPDFGATDPNTQNDVMVAKELALMFDIFGSDLDVAIVVGDTDKDRSGCQMEVVKGATKCQDTKLKVFNGCKKDALKGKAPMPQATSALDLQRSCMQGDPNDPTTGIPDPKGKIEKSCRTKLAEKVASRCGGTLDLGEAFPGLCAGAVNPAELAACVDQRVECHVCLALNAADQLGRDCDQFDDGAINGSCP